MSSPRKESDVHLELKNLQSYIDPMENRRQNDNVQSSGFFIDPDNRFVRIWDGISAMSSILSCILCVYMATLDSQHHPMWVLVYLCDIVNILDVVRRLFLGFKDKRGILNTDRKKIMVHYTKTCLLPDLASIAPLEIMVTMMHGSHSSTTHLLSLFRLNRVIRFWRVLEFFGIREEELGSNTAILRSMKYAVICFMTIHTMTCCWFALACVGVHEPGAHMVCSSHTWANNEFFGIGLNMTAVEPIQGYIVSLYWAVATATSTGYGDISAVNNSEKWFSIIAMLSGIAVFFGMLLGGMTSMLTNFDQKRADYVHRFENIKEHMKEEDVSEDLQKQVIGYYEYFWSRKKGVQMDGVYNNLPITFQAEICHSTNKEILQKAPIFENMGTGFLRMLSMKIHYQLCLPGQLIVSRGDIGQEMYFIHKGEVEVLSDQDDDTPVATLKAGKLFGEMSLIHGMPRVATIRAKAHCDLMVLERKEMNAILTHYPEVLARLQKTAKQRTETASFKAHTKETPEMANTMAAKVVENSGIFAPNTLGRRKSFAPTGQAVDELESGLKIHKKQHTVKMSDSVEVIANDGDEEAVKADHGHPKVSLFSRYRDIILNSTINPNSKIALRWHCIVIMTTLFIALVYPYMACATSPTVREGYFDSVFGRIALTITYLADIILFLDIIINLRMEVVTEHETLENSKDIIRHYVMSGYFVVDLVAVIPIEMIVLFMPHSHTTQTIFTFLRLNRVIKFYRIPQTFSTLEDSLNSKIENIRSIKFMMYIGVLSHWIACALFAIVCYGDSCVLGSWYDVWRESMYDNTTGPTPQTDYIVSLYFASATMTSTGYGDISGHTLGGRILALLAMLIGLLLYGYSLAAMAATLTTGDSNRVHYQEKLLAIKAFMKERHLDELVKKRVIDYLCILWEKHKGTWMPGMPPLIHDAPMSLQQDIAVEDAYHTIALCPLFKNTDDAFLRSLAITAQSFLFKPAEKLVYAGDICFEMYCIRQGYCDVYTADMGKLLCQIGPGKYFGDLDMLFSKTRDINIVANTSVEVLEITIQDLNTSLEEFPLVRQQFDMVKRDEEAYDASRPILYNMFPHLDNSKTQSEIELLQSAKDNDEDSEEEDDGFERDPYKVKTMFKFWKMSPVIEEEYKDGMGDWPLYARILNRIVMCKFAFNPMSNTLRAIASIAMILTVVQALLIPLQAAFYHNNISWIVVNYLWDVPYYMNMYGRLHLAYFNKEAVVIVTHPMYCANYYLNTNFIIDIFQIVPYEMFILLTGLHTYRRFLRVLPLLRFNRLLTLYRLPLVSSHIEASVAKPTHHVRIGKFVVYTAIFLNFMACVVFLVASPPFIGGYGEPSPYDVDTDHGMIKGSWIYNTVTANNLNLTEVAQSVTSKYVISLYWATATTVSVGYGDISANLPSEMVMALIIMVTGVVFFAYIIASVSAVMANADTQRGIFADKLRAIKAYMEDQEVPQNLQNRVSNHYNHLYMRTKGVNPGALFDALPQSLWGDLALGLYKNIFEEISLFKNTDISFMKMLCKCIQPAWYLKGEYIVRKHDIGKEMFFIHRGTVDVVSEDGHRIFDSMTVGQAFGEVALLFSCPRTASIRAQTNCDMFILTKDDLDKALIYYPEIRKRMLESAQDRLNKARLRSLENAKNSLHELNNTEKKDLETLFVVPKLSKHLIVQDPEPVAKPKIKPTKSASGYVSYVEPIYEAVGIAVKQSTKEEDEDDDDEPVIMELTRIDSAEECEPTTSEETPTQHDNVNQNNFADEVTAGSEISIEPEPSVTTIQPRQSLIAKLKEKNRFVIDPDNRRLGYFQTWMCFIGILCCFLVIFQCAFQEHHISIIILNYICDFFFIIDIYIKFHICYYTDEGDIVEDFDLIFKRYTKRKSGFLRDVLAMIPIEVFALLKEPEKQLVFLSLLRLPRLLRWFNVKDYFHAWEMELEINMLTMRLCQNLVTLAFGMHAMSSLWYSIACPPMHTGECLPNSWVHHTRNGAFQGVMDKYCTCLYWCTATMTSTGYGDEHAYTNEEMGFSIAVMIFGKLIFGFILGNIASTLQNAEFNRVQYDERLEGIKNNMEDQHVPVDLQERVIAYFGHLWLRTKGVFIQEMFEDCPRCLLSEVSLKIARPMLETIPLFEGAGESFFRQICLRVTQVLFLPGDCIIRKGDVGECLLYIHRGQVEIVTEDGQTVMDTMKEGQVFGEISLLADVPRKVTALARSHVDIFTLSKNDLDEVLEHYPVLQEKMNIAAKARFGALLKEFAYRDSIAENK